MGGGFSRRVDGAADGALGAHGNGAVRRRSPATLRPRGQAAIIAQERPQPEPTALADVRRRRAGGLHPHAADHA
jgi:hypothetical protein